MRNQALPTLLTAGIAATALLASSQALAYNQGDFITRVGVAHVDPKSDNGSLANGAIDVDVRSDTNLGFTLGYLFHDKLGVELLAALPFKHDIRLNGDEVASTKHLPPTLTLQYYPLGGTGAQVQPYAGVGLNYTHFFSEKLDIEGADLDLDSSWGLAGQLGLDVRLDDNWGVNAAAWYIDIDTDASLNGTDIGKVNIDPWVFMAGISYRF
ncbi:MAG: outer membrane beta-barrel protein [Halomonas sp.]|jgi:outer membrane protein|uniref:OmpW family protein n=1 Tax=Billgrantia tianxiuensis TaxID=2497861 RepID=A0A6I6SSQ5_9GAMM|nr:MULTISPECIES: OmpW family outer membrane protein [Halomonas]MCE8035668.1 outer membrane beta-barrel protein [Halomonas sp. MCCC 1A11057]MDX5432680.1 outer membrane beta-barrel protein [Halomonas sp.]QHC50730.1 OmpW family protein [Halomonas tianxiuensis]